MEKFEKWKEKFLYKRKAKDGFTKLDKYKSYEPELYPYLKEVVLQACYNASRYKEEGDVLSLARKRKEEQHKNSSDIIRALGVIKKHLESDLDFSLDIFKHGLFLKELEYHLASDRDISEDRLSLSEQGHHAVGEHRLRLIQYLDMYGIGLELFQETRDSSSSFYETCQEGNMIYWKRLASSKEQKIIPGRQNCKSPLNGEMISIPEQELDYRLDIGKRFNNVDPETHLIFELAVYFKLWTQEEGQCLFDEEGNIIIDSTFKGTPLPISGKPEIPIITDFVNATFALCLEKKQIKGRYSKLPKDAHLMEWQFEELAISEDSEESVKNSQIETSKA